MSQSFKRLYCRKVLKSTNCKLSIFRFLHNSGFFRFLHPLVASKRYKNVYLRSYFVDYSDVSSSETAAFAMLIALMVFAGLQKFILARTIPSFQFEIQ